MKTYLETAQSFFTAPLGEWWLFMASGAFVLFLGLRIWVWWGIQFALLKPFRAGKNANSQGGSFFQKIGYGIMGLALILVGFWLWGVWGGVGLGIVGFALFRVQIYQQKSTERKQLNQQLPLFLRALGSTLKAGYNVPQALEFVAGEVANPLRKKLVSGVRALRWQQSLEVVLSDWREEIAVPEFSFLADSLLLQSRTGGNLVKLCYRVAYLLEERQKLERDIRSFTAQGKMSGFLMAGLWPISLGMFAWLSPSHTDVLFSTPAGHILLGISLGLEAIGFYFIWRLVRLKI